MDQEGGVAHCDSLLVKKRLLRLVAAAAAAAVVVVVVVVFYNKKRGTKYCVVTLTLNFELCLN